MDFLIILIIFAVFGFVFGILIFFIENKLRNRDNKTPEDKDQEKENS